MKDLVYYVLSFIVWFVVGMAVTEVWYRWRDRRKAKGE